MKFALFLIALASAAQDAALLQQGANAMRDGRYADAERVFRQLLQSTPNDPRLHMNLGLALYSQGKPDQAIPELDRYLNANPRPGPVHLVAGMARLKFRKPCEAIPLLQTARKWQATADVLTELGDAYNGCKRFPEAAKTYEQAAQLPTAGPKLTLAAAQAYWEARDYSQARRLFAKRTPEVEKDPQLLYQYGDTLVRLEGASAGLAYLERASAARPAFLPARAALGKALVEANRAEQAIPHLEAAVEVDPALWLALSKAYRATGRDADAARATAEYRRRMSGGDRQ